MSGFRLVIPGEPRGHGRPRAGRTRDGRPVTFTAAADVAYRTLIEDEWGRAGRPALDVGPWWATLEAVMARPASHRRKDGTLSAAGTRSPRPTRKPDVDNVLKTIDALVACGAVPDDRMLVDARVTKLWATEGQGPCLRIVVGTVGA